MTHIEICYHPKYKNPAASLESLNQPQLLAREFTSMISIVLQLCPSPSQTKPTAIITRKNTSSASHHTWIPPPLLTWKVAMRSFSVVSCDVSRRVKYVCRDSKSLFFLSSPATCSSRNASICDFSDRRNIFPTDRYRGTWIKRKETSESEQEEETLSRIEY